MTFPKNITKSHLLKAIQEIDSTGIPPGANSKEYDVVHNNKSYPPKLIVSYANRFANGEDLIRNNFDGGDNTQCFKLLRKNGFVIVKKAPSSFYDDLSNFLQQAQTTNQKKSDYTKHFLGLTIKVSFGAGNQAKIPWIAFLAANQKVQNGIYPVYLYYKSQGLLILAYGVSETIEPANSWNLQNLQTIKQFFSANGYGKPARYGSSFVFKFYRLSDGLTRSVINNDLKAIIDIYTQTLVNPTTKNNIPESHHLNWRDFYNKGLESNFHFEENLSLRFIAALLTKPFVILTGLSGSGKTKLAQAFAMWISHDNSQYSIVPVGSDWTNREPLLGFPNALRPGDYVKPDNQVLDLIIGAINNPAKPYFLILDEMNLSHVERYFADFLSVMESGSEICLHAGDQAWNGIPPAIRIPANFFIIGTVNIDETTYMFSPKLLDRANVIEFRLNRSEMENFLSQYQPLNLDTLESSGSNVASDFVEIAKNKSHRALNAAEINSCLISFFEELKEIGAEFGFRTAAEILRLAGIINSLEPSLTTNEVIDFAIMQKLLPKVHGSRRKLEPFLEKLGNFCLQEELTLKVFLSQAPYDYSNPARVKYRLSLEKIIRMYQNVTAKGFTSYTEA